MVEHVARNLKRLGLSGKEQKIILALMVRDTASVSDIARLAKLPRTTITPMLEKLRKRGLLERVQIKGHKEWRVTEPKMLHARLSEAVAFFEGRGKGEVRGIPGRDIGIFVYKGKKQVTEAYEKMLDLSKTERVYTIQGNKSAEAALTQWNKQYILYFQEKFRKRQIIMETIGSKYITELLSKIKDIELLRSHADRMIIGYIVPDELLDFEIDIIIFRDVALLGNIKQETVVFVKNKAIIEALRTLFLALKEIGKRFDLRTYIEGLISNIEKST